VIKTVTYTAIEEKKFLKEAIKILTELGYSLGTSTLCRSKKEIEEMMAREGYKRGYNGVWITPGDIIPDEQ